MPDPFSLHDSLHLEEAAQPPYLKERLANDDADNKKIPPLDSAVCALGRVSVGSLTHDDIRLLIFDLADQLV